MKTLQASKELEKRISSLEDWEAGYARALEMVNTILETELVLAHTTESGKTSRLTSAINRIHELKK